MIWLENQDSENKKYKLHLSYKIGLIYQKTLRNCVFQIMIPNSNHFRAVYLRLANKKYAY